MFHFLGFIFLLLIAVLFIGFGLVGFVLRSLFGWKRRQGSASGTRQTATGNGPVLTPEEGELRINRKKVFAKDEGEYVDFEEIG